jgi:hypothetical protein
VTLACTASHCPRLLTASPTFTAIGSLAGLHHFARERVGLGSKAGAHSHQPRKATSRASHAKACLPIPPYLPPTSFVGILSAANILRACPLPRSLLRRIDFYNPCLVPRSRVLHESFVF